MRLLVTRPEPDAGETAAKLRAIGHDVLVQPLLSIVFAEPPADVPTPGAILITSQNGARSLARWPQIAAWRAVPVFAAGPATARAASALGFGDVRFGARDAGSLAEVVLRSLPRDVGPLLYPAARDRAGSLPDDLATRGYDVRTIEAYRAEPVARLDPLIRDALAAGSIAGILVYSRRTAKALLDIADTEGIKEALRRPVYYVISEHAAEAVRELGAPVVVAENPDEDSLFALIPAAC